MKIVYNKIIPFKGFMAINLFGICFVREEFRNISKQVFNRMIRHESIHTAQQRELLYVGFYIWYFIEWVIRLIVNGTDAYHHIWFEREAFDNERSTKYLQTRKPYAWLRKK